MTIFNLFSVKLDVKLEHATKIANVLCLLYSKLPKVAIFFGILYNYSTFPTESSTAANIAE